MTSRGHKVMIFSFISVQVRHRAPLSTYEQAEGQFTAQTMTHGVFNAEKEWRKGDIAAESRDEERRAQKQRAIDEQGVCPF
jgi:hypothetical protein